MREYYYDLSLFTLTDLKCIYANSHVSILRAQFYSGLNDHCYFIIFAFTGICMIFYMHANLIHVDKIELMHLKQHKSCHMSHVLRMLPLTICMLKNIFL